MGSSLNFDQLRKHFIETSCSAIAQEAKDEEYANNILEVFSNRLPQVSEKDAETIFLIEKALVVLPSSKLDTHEAKALLTFLENTGQFKNKEIINKLLRSSVLTGNLPLTQKMLALGADPNALVGLDDSEETTHPSDEKWIDDQGSLDDDGLDYYASIEDIDDDGLGIWKPTARSLLSIALSGDNEDIVLELLKYNINVKGSSDSLAIASSKNFTRGALILLNQVDYIQEYHKGKTALQYACKLKNEPLILALIRKQGFFFIDPANDLSSYHLWDEKSLDYVINDIALLEKIAPLLTRNEREIIEFIILTKKNQPEEATKKLDSWSEELLKQAAHINCLQIPLLKHGSEKVRSLLDIPKIGSTQLRWLEATLQEKKTKDERQKWLNNEVDSAVEENEPDRLRLMIFLGGAVNQEVGDFFEPNIKEPLLFKAVRERNDVIGKILLNYGAFVDARDSRGRTPLHVALELGNKTFIDLLIANKSDVHVLDNNGNSPLKLAASQRNLSNIPPLLNAGADLFAKSNDDKTTFDMIIANFAFEELNTSELQGFNKEALQLATLVKNRSKQAIQEKIDSWLDAENRDELFREANRSRQIKIWIVKYGSDRVYQHLNLPILNDDEKKEHFDNEDKLKSQIELDSRLQYAVSGNISSHSKILSYLGADPNNRTDYSGNTYLHTAINNLNLRAISTYLRLGASLDALNFQGKTPLDLLRQKFPEIPGDIEPDTLADILELLHFVRSHNTINYLITLNSWLAKENCDELFRLANSFEELKPYTFLYDDIKILQQLAKDNETEKINEIITSWPDQDNPEECFKCAFRFEFLKPYLNDYREIIGLITVYEATNESLVLQAVKKILLSDSRNALLQNMAKFPTLEPLTFHLIQTAQLLDAVKNKETDKIHEILNSWLSVAHRQFHLAEKFEELQPYINEYAELLKLIELIYKGEFISGKLDSLLSKPNAKELFKKAFKVPLLKQHILLEGSDSVYEILNLPKIHISKKDQFALPDLLTNQENLNKAFKRSVMDGSFEEAKLFTILGADIDEEENGKTLLVQCCQDKTRSNTALALIDMGADVTIPDDEGNTPLHWAYRTINKSLIIPLLQQGASLYDENDDEETPLDIAKTAFPEYATLPPDINEETLTEILELAEYYETADTKKNEEKILNWLNLKFSFYKRSELLEIAKDFPPLKKFSDRYEQIKPLIKLHEKAWDDHVEVRRQGKLPVVVQNKANAIIEQWKARDDFTDLLQMACYFPGLKKLFSEYNDVIDLVRMIEVDESSESYIAAFIDQWLDSGKRDELFKKALSIPLVKVYILKYGSSRVLKHLNVPEMGTDQKRGLFQSPRELLDQSILNQKLIHCIDPDRASINLSLNEQLIFLGADVNCTIVNGNTLLHRACASPQPADVTFLLKNKASLTIENDQKQTPLAIFKENHPQYKDLPSNIEIETLIDIIDLYKYTQLRLQWPINEIIVRWANQNNSEQLFKILKGIDKLKIYAEYYQEIKTLLASAEQSNLDQINATIDEWKKRDDGTDLLHFAFQFNALKPFLDEYEEILELLDAFENDNLTNAVDEWLKKDNAHELFERAFSFPLLKIYIMKSGSDKLYKFLNLPTLTSEQKGVIFNIPHHELLDQSKLNTRLLDIIQLDFAELTIPLLIFLGADVNTRNEENGFTPLIQACHNNASRKLIKDLIDAGAKVNDANIEGATALHEAFFANNFTAAAELLKRGASLSKKNVREDTPFDELKYENSELANIASDTEDNTVAEVLELLNLIEEDNANAVEEKINSWIAKPNKQDLFTFASIIPELNETIIAYQIQHNDQFPETSIATLFNQLSPALKNKFFTLIPTSKRKELIDNLTGQEKQVILSRQIIVVNSYSRQTDNHGNARTALETINTRALPFTESERGAYYIDQITHILDQIGFIGIHLLYQEQEYREILDRCIPYISGDQLNVITSLLSPNDWYRSYSNSSNINRKMQLIQSSNPEQLNTLSKQEFIDAGYFKAKNELREIQNTLDSHITKKDFSKLASEFKKRLNPDISQEDFREFITDLKTAIIPYTAKEGLEKLIESRLKPDMSDEEYLKLTDEIFSHLNELSEEIYQKLESDFYKLNLNQYNINQNQIWKGVDVALQRAGIDHPPNLELNQKLTEAKETIQSILNQQKNLAARLEEIEEQFETEIPEEFFDALFDDKIMSDPVKIPGGYIVDRSTLFYNNRRFPRNPFINNQHLMPHEIAPLPDLKKRIDEWTKDQWDKDQKKSP